MPRLNQSHHRRSERELRRSRFGQFPPATWARTLRIAASVIGERALEIGIGRIEPKDVDRLNVYWAAMEARRRAVEALAIVPGHVLVDGERRIVGCHLAQTPVISGDTLSSSIAAASIVAKVTRDSLMTEYARMYAGYGFERHKGYATADHIDALCRLGPLSLHRLSFTPVWTAAGAQRELQFAMRIGSR